MRTFRRINLKEKRMKNYIKISKGVYQTGIRSFTAKKTVNGITRRAICTSKTAAKKAYKTL